MKVHNRYGFRTSTFLATLILVSVSLFGCSKRYHDLPAFSAIPLGDPENESVGRFKTTYLADQIDAYFKGNVSLPIAVATFVDIDNLYSSSTFGRILSEQLMSELAMRGYRVIEVRQSDAMQVMDNEGEFGLSRDTTTLRGSQEVAGLVVGTYAVSPIRVYVNARLIDPTTSLVTSVGSVEMSKTSEITKLLRANSFSQTMERIPVRNLNTPQGPALGYQYNIPNGSFLGAQPSAPANALPLQAPKSTAPGALTPRAPSRNTAMEPTA